MGKLFLIFFIVLLAFSPLFVISDSANYVDLVNNADTLITKHGITKCVFNNNCGKTIFIPLLTYAEWTAFISNAPSCTSVCNMQATDSDGGQNLVTAGTCTYAAQSPCTNKCVSTYPDTCLSSTVLREYYVTGSTCSYTDVYCTGFYDETDYGYNIQTGGHCIVFSGCNSNSCVLAYNTDHCNHSVLYEYYYEVETGTCDLAIIDCSEEPGYTDCVTDITGSYCI
ncbi:MAG: hypothetical protein QW594_03205 [Candidatus Woesearchaeota archaeon]